MNYIFIWLYDYTIIYIIHFIFEEIILLLELINMDILKAYKCRKCSVMNPYVSSGSFSSNSNYKQFLKGKIMFHSSCKTIQPIIPNITDILL